jgi:hypothetical protein
MSSCRKLQLVLSILDKSILESLQSIMPSELIFLIFIEYNNDIDISNKNIKYMNKAFLYAEKTNPGKYFPGWKELPMDLYFLCNVSSLHINWSKYINKNKFQRIAQKKSNSKVSIVSQKIDEKENNDKCIIT